MDSTSLLFCYSCRQDLPVASFCPDRHAKGRRQWSRRCRRCQADYTKAWRRRNAAALREKKRAWAEAHPWDYRAWRMNHLVRKRFGLARGELTGAELAAIWGTGDCAYCGTEATTFDHIIPLERGGSNRPDNLCPACHSCNCSKKKLTPAEWAAWSLAMNLPQEDFTVPVTAGAAAPSRH